MKNPDPILKHKIALTPSGKKSVDHQMGNP